MTTTPNAQTASVRSAEQTVRDMFAAARAKDTEAMRACWADDAVWHNMPAVPVRGRDAVTRAWMGMFRYGVEHFEVEMRHLAASGDVVLTERIDTLTLRGGRRMAIEVSGTFLVRDGEILENREYWDWLATARAVLRAFLRR